MAWTDPKTWATNEVLTSTDMNTHLRDNLDWLANDHPRCQGNRAGTQSITDGASTAIAFNSLDTFDIGNMHDTASDNTRFTVPAGGDGLYHVAAWGAWEPAALGFRAVYLQLNGSSIFWRDREPNIGAGATVYMSVDGYTPMAAGDYVEMVVQQNSGGAITFSDAHLVIKWVAF